MQEHSYVVTENLLAAANSDVSACMAVQGVPTMFCTHGTSGATDHFFGGDRLHYVEQFFGVPNAAEYRAVVNNSISSKPTVQFVFGMYNAEPSSDGQLEHGAPVWRQVQYGCCTWCSGVDLWCTK